MSRLGRCWPSRLRPRRRCHPSLRRPPGGLERSKARAKPPGVCKLRRGRRGLRPLGRSRRQTWIRVGNLTSCAACCPSHSHAATLACTCRRIGSVVRVDFSVVRDSESTSVSSESTSVSSESTSVSSESTSVSCPQPHPPHPRLCACL